MAHPPIKFGPADKRQLIARKIVPQADDSPAIGLAGSPNSFRQRAAGGPP
jgi:hypothetical protein